MIELPIFYEMVQIQSLSHPHLTFSICKTWECFFSTSDGFISTCKFLTVIYVIHRQFLTKELPFVNLELIASDISFIASIDCDLTAEVDDPGVASAIIGLIR